MQVLERYRTRADAATTHATQHSGVSAPAPSTRRESTTHGYRGGRRRCGRRARADPATMPRRNMYTCLCTSPIRKSQCDATAVRSVCSSGPAHPTCSGTTCTAIVDRVATACTGVWACGASLAPPGDQGAAGAGDAGAAASGSVACKASSLPCSLRSTTTRSRPPPLLPPPPPPARGRTTAFGGSGAVASGAVGGAAAVASPRGRRRALRWLGAAGGVAVASPNQQNRT